MITGPINVTAYHRGRAIEVADFSDGIVTLAEPVNGEVTISMQFNQPPRRARTMKSKTHAVTIGGKTYLVQAITKAGAIRDVIDRICDELREQAVVDLATGEQIYLAGKSGQEIIGHDRFKNAVDPNQMGLSGIPETAAEPASQEKQL